MTVGSFTSDWFCLTIFGLCDYPAVTPYTVPFPSPKTNKTRPAVSGETPIQIVHFSDVHVDLSYEVGANYNCSDNICCRAYTAAQGLGNTSYPAGPWGNHNCDAPFDLEKSLYAAIQEIVPNAALTLFTGDVRILKMTNLTLVYGVVGNHDINPINSFPPSDINTTISSQYTYDALSALWTTWIGSTAAATAATNPGAYSVVYPGGNLRIISLNTMMYYKDNFWLFEATMETDPSGQLAWLVDEFQAAEDAGHTHKDEFQIAYSKYTDQTADTAVGVLYIAPALTPTSGNPAFRVYDVDPVTFAVLDMTEYITNMSTSTYQTDGPVWEKYYTVKEAYGPLMTPPSTSRTDPGLLA
ncbi:hypothetical protein UA08_01869 [Talaromyces atroroseus]|uniref:Calcineurin-like phosphoesterase domain-containing protein n=1 Tax=Talaromyces atroroseus TaxID=1441469 RepID=A0A1Q5QBZ7_TALAT|nr:hypothetical protein UA08_01869 [Talaromyces atroroseus]OKL63289.1 hypothetical protein UA08_01869 [Talaromyces atroroseus]